MKIQKLKDLQAEILLEAIRQKERYTKFATENKTNDYFLAYGMFVAYMDLHNKLKNIKIL